MGDGFPIIDVLLFGLLAAFLFFRLRSVLGQRTGHERQRPNPMSGPESPIETGSARDNVISMPERGEAGKLGGVAPAGGVLPLGLAAIKRADPDFNEEEFLGGARAAFEMIVDAFSRGESSVLQPLLAPDVMQQFDGAIQQRRANGETMETTLHSVKAIAIADAQMDGPKAVITIRYVTEQTNVTRDRAGSILDGDPKLTETATDLWTFARDVRTKDPNWLLIATRTDG
jgi:predicted lipid-binding transport protein (Tim44 family)